LSVSEPVAALLRWMLTGWCAAWLSLAFAALDINTANRAQPEAVRGVGTELAERAAFKDWADLIARVPGVGPASAARLSANGLTVGGAPYVDERR